MSDTRREISERHMHFIGVASDNQEHVQKKMESAMSDYAAAVLEDVAFNLWRTCPNPIKSVTSKQGLDRRYALDRLRARAAQERER